MLKKREKIIGIVMLAVMLIWISQQTSGKKKAQQARSRARSAQKSAAQNKRERAVAKQKEKAPEALSQLEIEKMVARLELTSAELDTSSLNDPFMKITPQADPMDFAGLILSGIILEETGSLAIINDKILHVGDTIAGFEIYEIRSNEVVLIKGAERRMLKLFTEDEQQVSGSIE